MHFRLEASRKPAHRISTPELITRSIKATFKMPRPGDNGRYEKQLWTGNADALSISPKQTLAALQKTDTLGSLPTFAALCTKVD
jgi:hypothetical protein